MPRQPFQRSNSLPYHVTARSNNRTDFYLPIEDVWKVVCDENLRLGVLLDLKFHAMVLMPNHLHMLVTTPTEDLGVAMNYFISSVTRTVNRLSNRSGHMFGGPYHRSMIGSSRYYGHALKYVYRNPVRAGICDRVEEYRYSTLHGLLGLSHLPFPVSYAPSGLDLGLPIDDAYTALDWLNLPFPTETEKLIRKGLRSRLFKEVLGDNHTPSEIGKRW